MGAGHGISRIAPILQDITMRLKDGHDEVSLKRVDLYWLIDDQSYFEWFTKMLKDIEDDSTSKFFNYHIFFLDRSPEEISEKMMYISINATHRQTSLALLNNLSDRTRFGVPDWQREFSELQLSMGNLDSKVFYSGPSQYSRLLKKQSEKLGITFKQGAF